MRNCAFFGPQVRISATSDAFFDLSALGGLDFYSMVQELERVVLCCG